MSMNLSCKECRLWQTPTYITYMCYTTVKKGKVIADDWEAILNRYIIWLEHQLDGVYKNKKELLEKQEIIDDHIKELKSFKKLHFYIT